MTNLIFTDLFKINVTHTHDKAVFLEEKGPKLMYDKEAWTGGYFIKAGNLLFETGIKEQNIPIGTWHSLPTIYKTSHDSSVPFDIFSAIFFLVTRYEEYLPHIRDKYDRFESESSLAYQQGFLHLPIVNKWCELLKKDLLQLFPDLCFHQNQYSYTSTIDIDNAFAFKEKGLMRTIGGFGRSVVNFFWEDFKERILVLSGKMQDPYDTYEMQLEIQKKYKLDCIYFFLLGDYGVNDKNLPSNNPYFQSLIKHLSDYANIGIHPSFGSNDNAVQVKKEINRLAQIVHFDIHRSRQHFLKLHFPDTYKVLVDNGITDDYTMGYATQIGFRAGICTPYYWYDLDTETETNLRVHPFAIMDATLRFYMRVIPSEIPSIVKPIIDEVKAVNGQMITIWHNETISNWREWKGWNHVYEDVVKLCV